MNAQTSTLFWKELHQLPRKRGAVLSALLFPTLFLLVVPIMNMVGMRAAGGALNNTASGVNLLPGMSQMALSPERMIAGFMMPFMTMIAGLMLPSVMATYTIIAERERRTLELLVALPVSVRSIILSKLGAVLFVAVVITVPMVVIDSGLLLYFGFGNLTDVLLLFWLLVAGLAYSTASALLVGLLAKDFRTANNITGAFVGPLILVAMGLIFMLPPTISLLTLGALLWLVAAISLAVALRYFTFERLLS
ncbi:MAG: ABC transporter permease [Chloroflexota bacterium]